MGSESPRRVIFYADADHLRQCEKDDVDDLGRYCAETAEYLRDVDQLSTPYLFQYGDKALTDGLGVVNLPHMRKTRGIATTQQVSRVTSDDASCHPQPLTDRLEPIVVPISASVRVAALPQVAPNDIPWEQKKGLALFRGSQRRCDERDPYNHKSTDFEKCQNFRRCRFVWMFSESKLVDARITDFKPDVELQNATVIGGRTIVGKGLSMKEQLEYKMLVMIEGNDIATGLMWALLSNSVVLMAPPEFVTFFMEELLEPWVHYVPFRPDYSDVEEKVQWVLDHEEEAKLIAERATLWVHDLIDYPEDSEQVRKEVLRRYAMHFVETNRIS